jgi:hypothetical protein
MLSSSDSDTQIYSDLEIYPSDSDNDVIEDENNEPNHLTTQKNKEKLFCIFFELLFH